MDMGKASKNTSTAFEQAFRQIKRWQDTFKTQQGRVNAELEKTNLRLKLSNKSARESASVFEQHARAVQENADALNRMKMSYDSNYAVEQRTLQLKKLLRQAIANKTMTVREAGAELAKYKAQLRAMNTAQMAATKATNRMGVVTQQAGYQVSDFIVQVQSGTNPFVAFSQQASQLAGVLPLVATQLKISTTAAIGLSSALGIIIPLIGAFGAFWLNARKELDDSAASVDTLEQNLKSLDGTLQDWVLTKRAASLGLTREELIATEGIASAEEQLAEAKRVLDEVTSMSLKGGAVSLLSTIPLIGDILPAGTFNNYQEAVAAAEAAVEKAEQRLEDVRQKNFEGRLEQTRRTMGQLIAERRQQAIDAAKAEEQAERDTATVRAALQAKFILRREQEAQREVELDRNRAAVRAAMDAAAIAQTAEREDAEYEAYQRGIDKRFEGEEALFQQAVELSDDLREKIESDAEAAARAYTNAFNASSFLFANRFADETALMNMPVTVAPNNKPPSTKTKRTGGRKVDPLGDLRKQLALENRMLGQTEARQRIMQALGDTYKDTSQSTIEQLEKQINVINEVKRAEEDRLQIQQTVESAFEDGFMSMIDGTKSVTEAFKEMARQIIAELFRVMVVQRTVRAITGAFGFADGGVFSGGSQVKAFANGGVVGGPTYFPMSGGQTGLMGEAGPEAIMPLKRGKDGKLGVQAEGGGNITVNQTINVSTGVQQTVRTEIKSLMPQIAESAKAAVADAKRRGGSYGKAF
jgi:hypothetical protein